jgi:hypothetical protein
MSDIDLPNPEDYEMFAMIIDGEIVHLHNIHKNADRMLAIYSSDPKIVKVPVALVPIIQIGWTYSDNGYVETEQL